jgi:hypothetical protein
VQQACCCSIIYIPLTEANSPLKEQLIRRLTENEMNTLQAEKTESNEPKTEARTDDGGVLTKADAEPAAERGRVGQEPVGHGARSRSYRHAAQGAALALALGIGWSAGSQGLSAAAPAKAPAPDWFAAATAAMSKAQDQVASIAIEVKGINNSIATLTQSLGDDRRQSEDHEKRVIRELEQISNAAETLATKLDEANRRGVAPARAEAALQAASSGSPPVPAEIPAPSEEIRMATALAVLSGTTAETKLAPPKTALEPMPVTAAPMTTAPRKLAKIAGWVLRDVYNGNALIEAPQRVLYEVAPGKILGGIGRVEAIERKGRQWVVVTNKGIIAHDGTP